MTRRTVRLSPPPSPRDPKFSDWLYQLFARVTKVFPAGLIQGAGTQDVTAVTNSSTVGQVLRVTGASTYGWGALDLADSDARTGTLPVANGGTGLSTLTIHALYVGNTTSAPTALAVGASNTFLKGSTGADPAFGTATLASADFANQGTTVTLLHGDAAGNPSWGAISLTADVTGDLPYANLAQGSALSVLGVTGNATADVASIAAASDYQVFRRSGTSVAFGAVDLAQGAAVTGILPDGNIAATLTGKTYNGLILTAAAVGFTLSGGTSSKTLTVDETRSISEMMYFAAAQG